MPMNNLSHLHANAPSLLKATGPLKAPTQIASHQQGAVAIIVALSLVAIIGMLGLVLDLGHLYVAKSELQNAADAAALSGAKQLNGTLAGICCGTNSAQYRAIEAAGKNQYDLNTTPLTIDADNLWVGNCPDDACMVPMSTVTTSAAAANKTFLKVDTGVDGTELQSLNTWFIHVLPGVANAMQTFGLAVAGHYVVDVTPLGICAVDKTRPEDGFIRGVAYNLPLLNPLAINPDPMWINPVASPPVDACADVDPQWNSRNKMAAFVCTGKSTIIKALPGEVYVNTGGDTALSKELNSRFDDYQGSKCDVDTAPPDANVQAYRYNRAAGTGGPRDWMQPTANTLPTQQGITITNRKPADKTTTVARTAPTGVQFQDYGALWTYSREKNFSTGDMHTLNDWNALYKGDADQTATGYPLPRPEGSSAPYAQGSGSVYFTAPPSHPTAGLRQRRLLNLVVIDCDVPQVNQVGPGNKCAALPTLHVGQFFMTVPADLAKRELFVEFSRMLPTPLPPADIRLYR